METHLGRGGQQCGEPRRNLVLLIIYVGNDYSALSPWKEPPSLSRHPEMLCGGICPITTWEKTLFCFARVLIFLNLSCSLQEDETTEAHSGWEHLTEHPLLPALGHRGNRFWSCLSFPVHPELQTKSKSCRRKKRNNKNEGDSPAFSWV